MSLRGMHRSLSAFALRTWATPQRAVRPASLAASAPPAVLDAKPLQASARAARPLASGALPELLATNVQSGVLAGKEACLQRSFHSRGHGVVELTGRAAWSSAAQVCSRRSLPHPAPSLSAVNATQCTAVFGSAVGVGVCSVATVQPASTIKSLPAHPGALPNWAINRTASGSRLSPR